MAEVKCKLCMDTGRYPKGLNVDYCTCVKGWIEADRSIKTCGRCGQSSFIGQVCAECESQQEDAWNKGQW